MKKFMVIIIITVLFVSYLYTDERETIFEGFGAKIVTNVDDMTDEKTGIIFLTFDQIYLAIYGHNEFVIWPNNDNLNFSFEMNHLIRVGSNPPYKLALINKRNCLTLTDSMESAEVITFLAKGETLKIRYFDWPQNDKIDKKIQNVNFGFIYNKASELFGWKKLDIDSNLSPVELKIYIPTDPDSKGYADIHVIGNRDLGISKNFDKYGGSATISVGVKSGFGYHNNEWVCGSVELYGNKNLIIRDSNGKIVFKERLPSSYKNSPSAENWPEGEIAAQKAWEVAPLGSIEIEGSYGKKVLLYGFKELWNWCVENADFPVIE